MTKKRLLIFIILALIYILNDFLFIYTKTAGSWLFVDYSIRIFSLLAIGFLLAGNAFDYRDIGFRPVSLNKLISWSIVLFVLAMLFDQILWGYLNVLFPKSALFKFPGIDNKALFFFDITIGLLIVALSEEIIFRGIAKLALEPYIKNDFFLCVVSALIFSSIHWSMGISSLVSSFLLGFFYMLSFVKTKSIYPAIASHYLANFVAFSNIIPAEWYERLNELCHSLV